ncbi:MAG: hypothetical protein II625_05120, partial [Bacilli bacterium]|nr:hypothetical protein [Bacilli bacterium]
MEEAIKRFLNDLNEDFAAEIYKSFGYDPDAEDIDIEFFETLLSRRPEILDNFFSYIKPYLDDPNFYASFDLTDESVLQKIFFSKIFISDEVYFRFIDEAIKQRDSKELPLVVMSSSDIDELLKRGYSLEEIADFELFSDSVCIELYNRDRSLYRKILRGYSTNLGYIVAKEYVSGNKDALGAYLDKFLFDRRFADVLDALSNYSINIKQFISDVGVFVNFDKDLSYSLIDDDVLLQKLINSWGPEAVIFGSTISKESAQLAADFTYDDYIFYDGSIKKSPYILLNLLNKGYTEALFNCDYRAINEDVIEFIKTHDFRYEDIAKSETLLSSYLINKMLTDIGYTGIIIHTTGALHDINAFNYVYDYFKNKYSSDEHIYSFYGSEVPVVKAFALGEDMDSSTYTVSPEVAERMIELGLDFKTFLEKYKRIKGLDQVFYAKGEKYALFASDDWNFINDHLDEVTYDDFLSFISMHSFDGDLNNQFIEKFFKEGHYEVANYLSEETLRYLDVERLGLEDISYEDYLKLPDKVKNLPLLKRKFTEKTPDELLALLATDSSTEVVYQALLAGVSPDKILSMSHFYNFDFKTTKLFLEKGCIDAIYQYSYSYSDKDNKKELVELFYKISGGLLPDFSRRIPCEEEFIEFYISKGMYEVLDDIYSFKYIKIDSILGEDYDLELFKKHPVFDGRIINRLITPENQEEVFQVILNHTSKNFSHLEKLIIHIIESDLDDNYIYPLSENFSFDINLLIRKSPIEIKDLLSLIYRKNLYEEKRYLDIILKNLTSSQIKSDLATFYVSDSMYMYIIHKMIEAGNYDFVSLYRGRVVISSLKEAIIHGVFPSSLKIDLDEYGRIIDSLSFTDKEIELFRSRLATEPQYALLIPDIKNNFELLIEYLKNAPEYLKLINKEYFKNPRLLVCLVTVDPKMTASYINKETSVETIATLIRVNPEILDYVYSFLITDDVVDLVSASYPEIIDKVSSGTDVAIENAFANGYVVNEKSRNSVIMHALLNGIPVPIEVLAKNMGPLFSTMWSTSTYSLFT